MVDTIKELSSLSKKLNEESNKLNSIISSINESLVKLNLGLEVWLTTPVVSDDWNDYDEASDQVAPWCEATLLGCTRVEDQWQLAVQEATLVKLHDQYGNEYNEPRNSRTPIPLLKASREVRLNAMSLLPMLLDELKRRGEELLQEIAKAEQAAEKLNGDD